MITLLGALYHLSSATAGRPKPGSSITAFFSLHTDSYLGDAASLSLGLSTEHIAITFFSKTGKGIPLVMSLLEGENEDPALSYSYFGVLSLPQSCQYFRICPYF